MNTLKKILFLLFIFSFWGCSQRNFIYPKLSYTSTHLNFKELERRYKNVPINKSQNINKFVYSLNYVDGSKFIQTKKGYNYFQVFINENGKVESIFLIKPFDKELDKLSINAIINSKFKPLTFHGKKSKYSLSIYYPFYDNKKIYPIINGIWTDPNYQKMISSLSKSSSDMGKASSSFETPEVLVKIPPVYPDVARQVGVEGTVELKVTVNEYGKVVDVSVLKSIPMLDKAAINAAYKCIFKPGIENGKPVKTDTIISYTFKLK